MDLDLAGYTNERARTSLLAEVDSQARQRGAFQARASAVLLADAVRPTSAALHRHEQHDHAEDTTEHGSGGLRMPVRLCRERRRMDHDCRRW